MNKTIDDCVFVKSLSGIKSPTFIDKESDDVLSMYKIDNCFDLEVNPAEEKLIKKLSENMDCNPDGWLIYIAKKHQEKIKKMIEKEFLAAYKNDELNFSNGELAETILFYKIDTGLIVELFDPECGSEFFYELVDKFKEVIEDEDDLLFFEFSHMPCNIKTLTDEIGGQKFLSILDRNNIDYLKD